MDTDTIPTSWKSDTIKTKHPNNATNAIKTNAPTSFPSNTSPTNQHTSHHPYGIKTTSTGILTRSNSYGKSPTTAHHYSPMSSPLAPIPRRSGSRGPESFKAHRLTKSMSSSVDDLTMSTPPPLPFPTRSSRSMSVSSGEDMDPTLDALSPSRARRSQTLPSIPTPPRPSLTSAGVPDLGILRSLDLPDNPKYWTPTNLALYLGTVLSLKHGGPFSDAVVRDVQVHVIREKLSGRTFLRLTEDDLDELGITPSWRPDLLHEAQHLRQQVIRGNMYGFSASASTTSLDRYSHSSSITLSETPSRSSRRVPGLDERTEQYAGGWIGRAMSPRKSASSSSLRTTSLSKSNLLGGFLSESPTKVRRYKYEGSTNGRVRGMVETFERSASSSEAGSVGAPSDDEDDDTFFSTNDRTNDEGSEAGDKTFVSTAQYPGCLGAEDIDTDALSTSSSGFDFGSGSEGGVSPVTNAFTFPSITQQLALAQNEKSRSDVHHVNAHLQSSGPSRSGAPSPTPSPYAPPPQYYAGPLPDHTSLLVSPNRMLSTLVEDDEHPRPVYTSRATSPVAIVEDVSSPTARSEAGVQTDRLEPSSGAKVEASPVRQGEKVGEVSMEELLLQEEEVSWQGAGGWETEDIVGDTARRIHIPSIKGSLSKLRSKSKKKNPPSTLATPPLRDLFSPLADNHSNITPNYPPEGRTVEIIFPPQHLSPTPPETRDAGAQTDVMVILTPQVLSLINMFKQRLEHVERRLDEMERRETERDFVDAERQAVHLAESERQAALAREQEVRQARLVAEFKQLEQERELFRQEQTAARVQRMETSTQTQTTHVSLPPPKPSLVSVFTQTLPTPIYATRNARKPQPQPPPLPTNLPHYVLAVSLGLAIVIVQSVFKRIARRS